MRSKLIISAFGVVCFAVLLTACHGGGDTHDGTAPSTDTFTSESATDVADPGGGSVTLTLSDGTVLLLEIPAGALTSEVTLTLATQKPVPGQRFNVLLEPAGLVLAGGATATLTIALPPGQTFPSGGGLVYDSVLVPFTTLADGRLQISMSAFAGTAVPASASGLRSARQSRSVRTASSLSNPCGHAPALETTEGLAAVDAVDIELYGQCMVGAVNALAANEQFEEAVRVADSVAAYLQRTGSGSADQLITQASGIACTAYGLALDRARTTTVTDMGTLYPLIKPILFWETVVQKLGASCSTIPTDEYQAVIHAKTEEALAYYSEERPNLTTTTSGTYASARTEADSSAQTKNEVLALNPVSAVRDIITSEVSQRAQPGLLDAMLQAPWDRCRTAADYGELINLVTVLGPHDSLKNAAQYCGTALDAQAKDSAGTVTAQIAEPIGGVSATVTRASGTIPVDKTGKLSISGPIQALQCPSGYFYASGSEALTVKIDGTTIQTLETAPYLSNPLEIDLAAALEAAHSGTVDQLPDATLTIERTGAPCNGFWGSNPSPLLTVNLSLNAGKIAFVGPQSHIYVMNSDASGITALTSGPNQDVDPAWAPDKSKIAFVHIDDTETGTIYVMNSDGGSPVPLTPAGSGQPAWSPDGGKIAYTYNLEIYVVDVSGGAATQVTGSGGQRGSGSPTWSPDGTKIALAQGCDIVMIGSAGGAVTTLKPGDGISCLNHNLSWSPDGTKLAYAESGLIYVMNTDGSGQTQISVDQQYNSDDNPAWSPDGKKLVFSRDGDHIFTMNADGSGARLLTSGYDPAW